MNMDNQVYETEEMRECGVYTCIHCVVNTCTLDDCEMFERKYSQEGCQ